MLKMLLGILLFSTAFGNDSVSNLTIEFENVQSTSGQFLVGFYADQESWLKRKPFREILVPKDKLVNGKMRFSINNLTHGTYGIAVLDDANGNETVDFGWIFPKEGFGFSNYYHNSLRLPRFSDFEFNLVEDKVITVKFRYLKTF